MSEARSTMVHLLKRKESGLYVGGKRGALEGSENAHSNGKDSKSQRAAGDHLDVRIYI